VGEKVGMWKEGKEDGISLEGRYTDYVCMYTTIYICVPYTIFYRREYQRQKQIFTMSFEGFSLPRFLL
jgi:hypothetical protein